MKIVNALVIPLFLLVTLMANAGEQKPVTRAEQASVQIKPIDKLKQELSLTDEQVRAIKEIHQQNRKSAMEERKADANSVFSTFFDLVPDSKEYEDAVKKMADMSSERARSNVERMAESRRKVYGLLNAEQKQKFLKLTKPPELRQQIPPKTKGEKPAVE